MRGNIKSFEKPFTHAEVVALAGRTLKRFGGDRNKAGRYARAMEDRYESAKWAQVVEVIATSPARRALEPPKTGGLPSHARKRKTPRQLEHEIAQNLASSGQPRLADLFTDPAATRAFAREMRHEIQKKQTSEKTTAHLAARPFVVKYLEGGSRTLFGRYPSEDAAQPVADRIGGWIEHEGRIIYGRVP